MQTFQYQYGERPLEGYTIQRGVGRGGFGEVYYAVSDSGKQVALKVLQTYEQVELRGIRQCMNLKNPHLVTIFDVKYNAQGRPFVIMEYVSGPSLSEIIAESGGGLGTQKAAFFLREIAKGLSHLHECGIVHRDLKPSNIFFEDGRVKIGDYGLSKAMNASRHSGQTITVGTVHYMAPEIGGGRYDRSVDIYALGVVLYEMLTGQVPFFGNSPAEVLMKHLSAEPDLTGIEEPFARVIRKTMAKDPDQRYRTVQAMVEDVFGAEHVRNSVSQFSPASLSMIGRRIEVPRGPGAVAAGPPPQRPGGPTAEAPSGGSAGERRSRAMCRAEAGDPINSRQRHVLAIVASLGIGLGAALFSDRVSVPTAFAAVLMVNLAAKLVLWARFRWLANMEEESGWPRRLALGAVAGVPTGLVAALFGGGLGWHWTRGGVLAIVLGLMLMDWWRVSDPHRGRRVSLGHALGAGLLAFVLAHIFGAAAWAVLVAAVLAGTSLVVQILTPLCMGRTARAAFEQVRGRVNGGRVDGGRAVPVAADAAGGQTVGGEAGAVVLPAGISPLKRLWALLLCGGFMIGLPGLHRFYVGKIGTGLLWFFTGGLCGIGQIVDAIMIITGQFTDSEGRRLEVWESDDELTRKGPAMDAKSESEPAGQPEAAQDGEAVRAAVAANRAQGAARPVEAAPVAGVRRHGMKRHSSVFEHVREVSTGLVSLVVGLVGLVLLLAAVAVGLAVALHVPQVVAAGFPEPSLAADIQEAIGDPAWPMLFEQVGTVVTVVVFLLATVLILVARRHGGGAHLLRAVLGLMALLTVLMVVRTAFLYADCGALADALRGQDVGQHFSAFTESVQRRPLYTAAGLFVFSAMMLAWPPRKHRRAMTA